MKFVHRKETLFSKLLFYAKRSLVHPERIPEFLYQTTKRILNRTQAGDIESQERYYEQKIDRSARIDPRWAVGSRASTEWEAVGKHQFEYLEQHGLQREHLFLDVGCGNLRSGRWFISYLDAGNYVGIDISKEILLSAQSIVVRDQLQSKLPRLYLVRGMDLAFLPTGYFDVAYAHSVFSHVPRDTILQCLRSVRPLLKPNGFFDFTFLQTDGKEYNERSEDFYFRLDTIRSVLELAGYSFEVMSDWEHHQTKIRARPLVRNASEARAR